MPFAAGLPNVIRQRCRSASMPRDARDDLGLDRGGIDRPSIHAGGRDSSGSGLRLRLGGLAADDTELRLPSRLSESSVSPSRLRTTPAKNPRTEGRRHPVVFTLAMIVRPRPPQQAKHFLLSWKFERGNSLTSCFEAAACTPLRPAAGLDFGASGLSHSGLLR